MHCLLRISFISVLVSVLLNLLLPLIIKPFASEKEINPGEEGVESLSFKEKFVHMLIHHNQVPLVSSLIVALVVFISVEISGLVLKDC